MKQNNLFLKARRTGSFLLLLLLLAWQPAAVWAQKSNSKEKPETNTQAQTDDEAIRKYLKAQKLHKKFKKTDSGVYYFIEKEGDGTQVKPNTKLKVHYKGTLLDGTVFDSSYDRGTPIEFTPNMVIKGWQEGLTLFTQGAKGTLIIPSGLAYGNRAMGDKIAPNSILRFDMELLEVKETAPPQTPTNTAGLNQAKIDDDAIQNYLKKEGLTDKAQKTESGLYYIVETEGSGKQPDVNALVTVHYKGTLLNGTVFDSSYDRKEPLSFPLSGVIRGWQEGIPKLKEGGKGVLIIPSGLAYGSRDLGVIPSNSVLRFDVELLEVKSGE
ncbi:peptidylprolyl isomerase [Sphingobacteriales bacterium UPWRP_1]|nr:hypothetical protein B6N25_03795 [Sphingobacteriales bacterium TSM_CSS]PSJ76646.1 peptidylprolyl isomerase [Sphingobacteriales bacterium UPWRP_1]